MDEIAQSDGRASGHENNDRLDHRSSDDAGMQPYLCMLQFFYLFNFEQRGNLLEVAGKKFGKEI